MGRIELDHFLSDPLAAEVFVCLPLATSLIIMNKRNTRPQRWFQERLDAGGAIAVGAGNASRARSVPIIGGFAAPEFRAALCRQWAHRAPRSHTCASGPLARCSKGR
jgi:hypothetical protein